jgi:hypothetical protein
VQGAELSVLRGAQQLIRKKGVDLMLVEFQGDADLIRLLADDFLLFDTEYVGWCDPAWADKWLVDVKRGKLTTGADAFRGRIGKAIPRDIEGYAAWLRAQEGVQTDLVAVNRNFVSAVETAVQKNLDRLAS